MLKGEYLMLFILMMQMWYMIIIEYIVIIIDHYNDVTMGSMASQITSLTIVYSAVY